ncbi:hypothetical protein PoB_001532700 [Plakobranchus ocellatus]|uniref:Uncharacterized protein n=1 Tax=Plakobranchus ocellatus TaxID=259542 RepID=A0AAV3Z2U9_9GAST|nr:hypothetical protein PoB_001532700 [Plakobranchus ocellatus]
MPPSAQGKISSTFHWPSASPPDLRSQSMGKDYASQSRIEEILLLFDVPTQTPQWRCKSGAVVSSFALRLAGPDLEG